MTFQHILVITQDFPPERGGIQTYLYEMTRHFHERGHTVTVICPGRKSTPSPLPPEVSVIRIGIHSSWLFLPLIFRLPRLLREGRFSHVFYAQWQGMLSELLVSHTAKRHQSLVLVCGRELLTSVLKPFHRLLCRRVFRRVDIAVPISSAVETLLRERGRPAGRVIQIHPGVDPERFSFTDPAFLKARYGIEEGPVVVCIARMVQRKGMDLLIRAFSIVLKRIPSATLLLGGEGPESVALHALVVELGIEKQVRFAGRISDGELASHYSLATVFALPVRQSSSDVEGFGIVYIEAGACEVPVIGTRTGGVLDAVEEGVTGLLVPPEDVPALAAALVRLLEDRKEAREMGLAARLRILRELTWSSAGDKFLDLMK